jgi:ubiquitin carboxyl-terminal hydrolase 8
MSAQPMQSVETRQIIQNNNNKQECVKIEQEYRFKEFVGMGQTGLMNLGNTCFVNSCLQALSHTYELNRFLQDGSYKKKLIKKPDSVLLHEWDKLRTLMWSENCVVSPGGFMSSMKQIARLKNQELFTQNSQNDVQEFLMFMLDSFHMALSREVNMTITGNVNNDKDIIGKKCYEMMKQMFTKNYSEMLNIFYGIQMSVITNVDAPDDFSSKDVLSLSSEPFSIISMPIPIVNDRVTGKTRIPTLYDCFKHYSHGEKLEGSNAWFNEKTNTYQSVQKRISFWSLPNIMIIDLKRVQYTEHGPVKITIPVELPLNNLVMSEFVNGYKKESYVYELYAVCNHHGNTSSGGHYTATIRTADNKWYNFNDEHVKPIDMKSDKIVSNMPYCLFYRKVISK